MLCNSSQNNQTILTTQQGGFAHHTIKLHSPACSFSLWKRRTFLKWKTSERDKMWEEGKLSQISFLESETCECLCCYKRSGLQGCDWHTKRCRFLLLERLLWKFPPTAAVSQPLHHRWQFLKIAASVSVSSHQSITQTQLSWFFRMISQYPQASRRWSWRKFLFIPLIC